MMLLLGFGAVGGGLRASRRRARRHAESSIDPPITNR